MQWKTLNLGRWLWSSRSGDNWGFVYCHAGVRVFGQLDVSLFASGWFRWGKRENEWWGDARSEAVTLTPSMVNATINHVLGVWFCWKSIMLHYGKIGWIEDCYRSARALPQSPNCLGLRMQWGAPASQVERWYLPAGRLWGPPHRPRTPPFESVPAMATQPCCHLSHGFFDHGNSSDKSTIYEQFLSVAWDLFLGGLPMIALIGPRLLPYRISQDHRGVIIHPLNTPLTWFQHVEKLQLFQPAPSSKASPVNSKSLSHVTIFNTHIFKNHQPPGWTSKNLWLHWGPICFPTFWTLSLV